MGKLNGFSKVRNIIFGILLLFIFGCSRISENDIAKELAVNTEVTSVLSDVSTEPLETIPAQESILEIEEVVQAPVQMTLPEIYLSQIGVREATGRNDGPEVEMYLKAVNLGKGKAWCSAFVAWSLNEANIPHRINAWSPTAENRSNFIYRTRSFVKEPQAGDVFTIWYTKLKRIGHTGFYHANQNESIIITVEGNTNEAGSREGDGVYKKYRSLKTIHSISRWENQLP